jgi:abortive infection bacteriophage resistance protein
MKEFSKSALKVLEQIELLEKRGLAVPDTSRAERYLKTIGYYRLSAYYIPFQTQKDLFEPNTSFDHILNLYIADRKLRLLVMDALERIEIAVRTIISNVMSENLGPHWYLDAHHFIPHYRHDDFLKNVAICTGHTRIARRNTACSHYFQTYSSPALPPSWMVIEVLPLGTWSRLYEAIKEPSLRKKIARPFDFYFKHFSSWLHALTLIRNNVAHHSRFWNHSFPPKTKNPARYTHKHIDPTTPYFSLAVVQTMLKRVAPGSSWSDRLAILLATWPLDIHKHMRVPENWRDLPFWHPDPR